MRFSVTTTPAIEPVDLDQAKAHLRVDITDDDSLISSLVTAAREYVERVTRLALITQTITAYADMFPLASHFALPRPPLQSITSLTYTDGSDVATVFSSALYAADTVSQPGRLVLKYDQTWPTPATLATVNPIAIVYVAGYGNDASDVPQIYKQAIYLLLAHWYENREAIVSTGAVPKEIPLAVQSLLMVDRNWQ